MKYIADIFFPGLERQRQIEEYEEFRGFDLSPAHPLPVDQDYSQNALSHRGDHSQSLKGEHSQSLRGEQSQSHRGGFETSHTEDTEMYLPVTQVVSLSIFKYCLRPSEHFWQALHFRVMKKVYLDMSQEIEKTNTVQIDQVLERISICRLKNNKH